jgi:hypothetical protein
MNITIETSSYNDRRYGKPWIAEVTFQEGHNGIYRFGTWIGLPGQEGILEIEVNENSIIARGQKDHRKPRNSAPEFFKANENGSLIRFLSKAEAYKFWKCNH